MSNERISRAFTSKAFIGFLTAGDPSIEKSGEFALEMARAGADLIEIGIPFSDPVAEGAVIQAANARALNAGASLEKVFALVSRLRTESVMEKIPLVFLTYLNPVFRYGYESFFARCEECGVDGIIIPDLPFEEQDEVRRFSSSHNVDLISLIAPTSEDRVKKIAACSDGFLYIVSSMGVTGVRDHITTDVSSIIQAAKTARDIPAAVGFGVSTPEQAAALARVADGVIVGSAIVRIIADHGENAGRFVYEYVKKMKDAVG